MKHEPETKGVKTATHYQLGLRVLASDTGHHAAACRRIDYITRQGS